MRVLFETSVLISFLRSAAPATSAIGLLLRAALRGRFTLLAVAGVIEELENKLAQRTDLATKISFVSVENLVATTNRVAEQVPRLPEPYPEIGRDRKDDFVIAHAVAASADFLVSWDKDLLDLQQVEGVRIVSPPEVLHVLREAGLV